MATREFGRRNTIMHALTVFHVLFWLITSTISTAFSPNDLIAPTLANLKLRNSRIFVDPTISPKTMLYMAKSGKKKAKKKGNSGSSGSGLRGFGAVGVTKGTKVEIDRSSEARSFYNFMEGGGAGDNLSQCAIGIFPIGDDFKLRGVAALKPVKMGDAIIRIPYDLAINLGQEGVDPTGPAVMFLKDYCETLAPSSIETMVAGLSSKAAYYQMLPEFGSDDCLGSTDFFSEEALTELQAPLIVEETNKRKEQTKARFQSDIAPHLDTFPKWIDGTALTEDHLAWAVWLVTSRVLTVQGDAKEGKSYRLLIPFLDMCNHDRASSHVLTGRAVPGGELKVVAGAPVKEGDPINICYGGGMAGNDRFLQDYGFLDTSKNNAAYDMVAQQILGKRRILEGVGAGRLMSESDRQNTLDELRKTTVEEDTNLVEGETNASLVFAYKYRIGVKNALLKYGEI